MLHKHEVQDEKASPRERILRRVPGIAITRLTSIDIVRHPLVARIVDAYDAARLSDLPLIEKTR